MWSSNNKCIVADATCMQPSRISRMFRLSLSISGYDRWRTDIFTTLMFSRRRELVDDIRGGSIARFESTRPRVSLKFNSILYVCPHEAALNETCFLIETRLRFDFNRVVLLVRNAAACNKCTNVNYKQMWITFIKKYNFIEK